MEFVKTGQGLKTTIYELKTTNHELKIPFADFYQRSTDQKGLYIENTETGHQYQLPELLIQIVPAKVLYDSPDEKK